ncbi:hypothetical protein [Phenylobacterium zucineum]|uniref:hypothetical protein n=1 Tax=Phenylobacterium zucineum TaxID=284016 RepID=UPI0002F4E588|nr:hypothetical protein [Phenylobacterium zucineum]
MSRGYGRNAELSRAVVVTAAGGAVIAMSQQAAVGYGPTGQIILAAGGAVVAFGLYLAVRTMLRRRGDADQ